MNHFLRTRCQSAENTGLIGRTLKLLIALTLCFASAISMGHRIVLIQRSVTFLDPVTVGWGVETDTLAWDAPEALTIRTWQAGRWSQSFGSTEVVASYSESLYQNFKLEWIPEEDDDVPGSDTYTMLVTVTRSVGSLSGLHVFPPYSGMTATTTACWFGNVQTQQDGYGVTEDPTGFRANFLDDLQQYRQTASTDYPIPVTFAEQEDGTYVGTAVVPSVLLVSFVGAGEVPVGHLSDCWGGVIIRSRATECAGVEIEEP